ncbi:short-chain dehydrogenase [Tistrella bauzanensis]|uniref:Short-chain dehydrogenase n=1 Tax=Tistrella bauzanensis TaxID=657419 RepID=A0ABQ1J4E2_9PROT|nr:SDR family NAD(P)-dependent oxidoreductase [Tistrella bauzanensis]GGB59775.1 short-chain dehydrogenase [Tistrella bauzanensis]
MTTTTRPLAIVTGASGGIGREIALALATRGYDLLLIARNASGLARTAEAAGAAGARSHCLPLDLSGPADAIRANLQAALDADGRVPAVLVNNAGFGIAGRFDRIDPAAIDGQIAVDIAALTILTRAVLPAMVAAGRGRVLNLASTAAFVPGPGLAVYYAAKAYVVSLGRALAVEMAGTGVTVTTLCPGPTRTGFAERAGMAGSRLFSGNPGLMTAGQVARIGLEATFAGRPLVVPGRANRLGAILSRLAPPQLAARMVKRLHPDQS